jgi:hypothetical protein
VAGKLRRLVLVMSVVCASGCIDRSRLNANCDWTGDSAFPLDLSNPVHQRHLIDDAQLAEGLAVRFSDTEHRRRYGYGGHGRLVDYGTVLHQCFGTLTNRIEHDHRVTAAAIDDARAQRSAAFDLPVILSFALLYAMASWLAAGWIDRRFTDGTALVRTSIAAIASLAVAGLGLQLMAVWGGVWECVRIGDDHFGSFRATRSPVVTHLGAFYAGGVVLFWTIALAYSTSRAERKERAVSVY